MELRPYQTRAVEACVSILQGGGHPVLSAPTGSGKTTMAAEIVRRLARPTLWIAHRRELVFQAAETLRGLGLEVGVVIAGEPERREAQVQVGSVQTLARRAVPPCGLFVVDEAHHATADSYMRLRARVGSVPMCGLSATPWRIDGRGLGRAGFTSIVKAAEMGDLIRDGFLVPVTAYAPAAPDMSGARIRMGDYAAADLEAAARTVTLRGRVVEEWIKRAGQRTGVVFAVDVAHSKDLCERFQAAGVQAEHLDGETPHAERAAVLARVKAGTTKVLVNVGIATEGLDVPELSAVLLARPTASSCLYRQMVGRGMRPLLYPDGSRKADMLLIDLAGNVERHGEVTEPVTVTLADGVVRDEERPKGRVCRVAGCGYVNPPGSLVCKMCGTAFPPPQVVQVEEPDGAAGQAAAFAREASVPFTTRSQFYTGAYYRAKRAGWSPGAAAAAYRERFGVWPLSVGPRLVDPVNATEIDWVELRTEWRLVGERKDWGRAKTEWFVGKQESEARARAKVAAPVPIPNDEPSAEERAQALEEMRTDAKREKVLEDSRFPW